MRTGEVEADLTRLPADAPGAAVIEADVAALTARLVAERDRSGLPEVASNRRAVHDLVVTARLR